MACGVLLIEGLKPCRRPKEEEVAYTDIDSDFEFACRFLVMKSCPGWIEICTENLRQFTPFPRAMRSLAIGPRLWARLKGDLTGWEIRPTF